MNKLSENASRRKAALVAGTGLLAMTIFAVGAISFVFKKLIVYGDAGATVNNILAGEMQFRIGIACLFIVAVLDVIVAWALYVFLEATSKNLSLLTAWFRLVYAAILGVALFSYTDVLRLLGGANYMKEVEVSQWHAEVMLSLRSFDDGWAIGLMFFGIHLVLLGYLVFKSGYVPRMLGIVLGIAGAAYLTDGFSNFMLPKHTINIAEFLGWGELLFMLWLLYTGLKAPNASLNTDG
jgi:hypothetical protein